MQRIFYEPPAFHLYAQSSMPIHFYYFLLSMINLTKQAGKN